MINMKCITLFTMNIKNLSAAVYIGAQRLYGACAFAKAHLSIHCSKCDRDWYIWQFLYHTLYQAIYINARQPFLPKGWYELRVDIGFDMKIVISILFIIIQLLTYDEVDMECY